MKADEIERQIKSDLSGTLLLRLLILYLERRGLMKNDEFIAFLDQMMPQIEAGLDPATLAMLRGKIAVLRQASTTRTVQ